MLETVFYFKIIYFFAVTGKSKMSRFNNPGMNRTNSHFMNFLPVHAEKLKRRLGWINSGNSFSDWFQPRMAVRPYSKLLKQFAFK